MRQGMRAKAGVTQAFDRLEVEADENGDDERVPVIGVHTNWASAPAGLGIVLAHAQAFDDGALRTTFDFRPRLVWDEVLLRATSDRKGVYLFSNYVWNHDENMRLSAIVKQANPDSVTIHGGPNTPKYRPDVERFFAQHPTSTSRSTVRAKRPSPSCWPHFDGHVGDGPADLAPLEAVPGLSYRHRGESSSPPMPAIASPIWTSCPRPS